MRTKRAFQMKQKAVKNFKGLSLKQIKIFWEGDPLIFSTKTMCDIYAELEIRMTRLH